MKKKLFLAMALLALMAVGAFAQEYNSESDFKVKKEGNGITITKYSGKATVVNIPPTIQNLPVTSIGKNAFKEIHFITSVTIPDSVTSIGNSVFYYCTRLTSVTIGNGVTSIEQGAFRDCTGITSVTFQGTIPSTGISSTAFFGFGDLLEKYLAGGVGTYTTGPKGSTWTKQGAAIAATPTASAATPQNSQQSGSVSLVGTTWINIDLDSDLKFISPTNVIFGGGGFMIPGTYTISGNKVTITVTFVSSDGYRSIPDDKATILTGTLSGNVLTINDYGAFKKQR